MKLLISGSLNCSEDTLNFLDEHSIDTIFMEREDGELDFNPKEIDAVICNWLFVNHDIEQFEKLKYIQLMSAGLDRVPLEYIKDHRITLKNAAGVYSIPMAEHALCGVLQLYRQSVVFQQQKQKKVWNKIRNLRELTDKVICIVGAGDVGSCVAKKFSSFTSTIYGVDINTNTRGDFSKIYPLDRINDILEISDVIIVTLPLTKETNHMFNASLFSHMKEGAVFVNIARGGVVDEMALLEALSNRLYGAVLDVFENEPLKSNNRIWDLDNVILTPHNSFVSENNANRMDQLIRSNLSEFIGRGEYDW